MQLLLVLLIKKAGTKAKFSVRLRGQRLSCSTEFMVMHSEGHMMTKFELSLEGFLWEEVLKLMLRGLNEKQAVMNQQCAP